MLRQMPMTFTTVGEDGRVTPNLFKWSFDGAFVAHMASVETKKGEEENPRNCAIKVHSYLSVLLNVNSI